jgi:hypothetical protein
MATLKERLHEAENAKHKLMTGTAVAEFTDADGLRVKYTLASLPRLERYIAELSATLSPADPIGPMGVCI